MGQWRYSSTNSSARNKTEVNVVFHSPAALIRGRPPIPTEQEAGRAAQTQSDSSGKKKSAFATAGNRKKDSCKTRRLDVTPTELFRNSSKYVSGINILYMQDCDITKRKRE
jgi:hypothetical protein